MNQRKEVSDRVCQHPAFIDLGKNISFSDSLLTKWKGWWCLWDLSRTIATEETIKAAIDAMKAKAH